MVSDQPSWGRRNERDRVVSQLIKFQTNPRGVGGADQFTKDVESDGFRPTLVGSEEQASTIRLERSHRFRPTLVGSEVQRYNRDHRRHDRFQTNPRGVGGRTLAHDHDTDRVSDQPSWGRRSQTTQFTTSNPSFRPTLVGSEDPSHKTIVEQAAVSDQPSWGRRSEQSLRVS